MPQNFTRHKMNTTYLKWKTNELFWRIEWIFPQAENTNGAWRGTYKNDNLGRYI